MTPRTRRLVVLVFTVIVGVAFAALKVIGWEPVVSIWNEFREQPPLQQIIIAIGLLGAPPGLDYILFLIFQPPPDTRKVWENFDQWRKEQWEQEQRVLEKESQAQQLSPGERQRREADAGARFKEVSERYRNDVSDPIVQRSEKLKDALSLFEQRKDDEGERKLERTIDEADSVHAASAEEAAQAARILATRVRLRDVTRAARLYERAKEMDQHKPQNWIDWGETSQDAADLTEGYHARIVKAYDDYKAAIEPQKFQRQPEQFGPAREGLLRVVKGIDERLSILKEGKLRKELEPCKDAIDKTKSLLSEQLDEIGMHPEHDRHIELERSVAAIANALAKARAAYLADARTAYEHVFEAKKQAA
jgi:hypothetical protein